MRRVAILGATGHIGKALADFYIGQQNVALSLYSRRPEVTRALFAAKHVQHHTLDELGAHDVDVIINAIGIGDPAVASNAGPEFYRLTLAIEDLVDVVAQANPGCLTVYMSSGAIYGPLESGPASETTLATVPLNLLRPSDWYGASKLAAELRHRAQPERRILDIRIFGFVSEFLDLGTRYLVCDIVNSIRTGQVMRTNNQNVVRDYISTLELATLIELASERPVVNVAVDTYSLAPVSKFDLLESLRALGLRWSVESQDIASTGRTHYWSRYHAAEQIGYVPERKAIDIVQELVANLTRSE
ncbi:NAD-dependent epimerase/dehydratase family protein [Hyphomicrobium sp. D-2]|uniref:NAD-dependent epimerase/dehydratase family protein n=1 Tax=Hyphomicrobium sp. D-2 TaxID=3041621 RepID=UPI002454D79B|nr:NAD-dependent epimerase/dehydratase family protein [Hyphomicrobium sp. D-2]MDH4981861.1 NAD-dependent epimerase/dehydratase family protein [Hyphomicrobium sp. D-2]